MKSVISVTCPDARSGSEAGVLATAASSCPRLGGSLRSERSVGERRPLLLISPGRREKREGHTMAGPLFRLTPPS